MKIKEKNKAIIQVTNLKRTVKTRFLSYSQTGLAVIFSVALMFSTIGCDNKEKVLDVETPAGELEIEKDKDSGDVDIKIEDK